jgi:hypothetical protein
MMRQQLSAGAWRLSLAGMLAITCGASLQAGTILDQLRDQFNKDKGILRLVVLVSPTCPQCASGAGWINEYALKRNPKLNVKVYTVWYEMYPGDDPSDYPEARELMKDKRVTHYWDQGKDVGKWFYNLVQTNVKGTIEWDAFYLYSPESVWGGSVTDRPTELLTWGRTILRDRKKLTGKIAELTGAAAPAEEKPEQYDSLLTPATRSEPQPEGSGGAQ